MISHIVLPIRFGHSTRRVLTDRVRQSLFRAGQVYFDSQGKQEVLPIEWISTNFRIARSAILELLIGAVEGLEVGQNVIIDLGGPNQFDPIDPESYFGLADFCETKLAASFKHILLICPGRLLKSAPETKAHRRLAKQNNVSVIFLEGSELGSFSHREMKETKGTRNDFSMTIEERFLEHYLQQKVDTKSQYQATVFRVPGLFPDQTAGDKFAFTYDFSQGGEFALQLCQKKIENCEASGIEVVFYLADRDWFSALVTDAKILTDTQIHFEPIKRHEQITTSMIDGRRYAIFCSVVRSGGQFVSMLEGNTNFPEFSWCLGSIDEGGGADVDVGVRKVMLRFGDDSLLPLDLHYEARIDVSSSPVQELWKKLPIDVSSLHHPNSKHQISAAEIWAMMIEAGFGPESYGPERAFLPAVPKFTDMVPWNYGFFTMAIRHHLKNSINYSLTGSDLILCVDEEAALNLARNIVGFSYEKSISVPRSLLNGMKKASGNEGELVRVLETFQEQVRLLKEQVAYAREVAGLKGSRKMQAIIVDELIVSGSTFKSLDLLSDIIGLDILFGLSILKVSDIELNLRFPIRPLYTIPVPSLDGKAA